MSNYEFETEQYYGNLDEVISSRMKGFLPIYRLTGRGNRVYFKKAHKDAEPVLYNSGTTLIDNYRDKEGEMAIHRWKVNLINQGKNPDDVLYERQTFGSLSHLAYGRILMGEKTTFKKLPQFIASGFKEIRTQEDFVKQLVKRNQKEFSKDIASLLTWIRDYDVKVLAVELMLASEKYKTATALDLICEITDQVEGYWGEVYKSGPRKGEAKKTKKALRRTVIVDFKTGKKGFYSKNVLQLLLSREIFEENFPDIKIDGIYNFAPNDWKKSPSYKFYDQERTTAQIDHLREIAPNIFERGLAEFEQKISKKAEKTLVGDIDMHNIPDEMVVDLDYKELATKYFIETFVSDFNLAEYFKKEEFKSEKAIRNHLRKTKFRELKELATLTGIPYEGKLDFIKLVIEKYNTEWQGKR